MPGLHPCGHRGCPTLTKDAHCQEHSTRGNAEDRRLYRTERWARLRRLVLIEEPFCMCDLHHGQDIHMLSTVVHHKVRHGGDPQLFFDRDILEGLAKRCHDRYTGQGR